jgi:hypothetical protein
MYYLSLFLILILFIIIGIIFYFLYIVDDTFTTMLDINEDIKVLSKEDASYEIIRDTDGYFKSLTNRDLRIRDSSTVTEYKQKSKEAFCDINKRLQDKLKACCRKIKERLLPYKHKTIMGISIQPFLEMPWKFAVVSNNVYENGFPHTRNDIIVLPKDFIENYKTDKLCKLLIHEKVHVYQKTNKDAFYQYLRENEFERTGSRSGDPANPDLDQYRYTHTHIGDLYATYSSTNPSSFQDISYMENKASHEHPFEYIAYKMENIFDKA